LGIRPRFLALCSGRAPRPAAEAPLSAARPDNETIIHAVRTAETCRDLGWDAPADAYGAACFLGWCIPIVAKHDKLDDKQRQEAALFYGDAAMKLLRDAVSKGYKDVAHMKKDTDLDPLRQRGDFQKVVAELEEMLKTKWSP
jgi:hypothetical protein